MPGDPRVYVRVNGPAFYDGASPDDVAQGHDPDCWLMASLAAIAKTDPGQLENIIQDNGDGTFDITFQEKYLDEDTAEYKFRPHVERVDSTFPAGGPDGFLYAGVNPKLQATPELWPALIEKGFAQWRSDSYFSLAGNTPNTALEAITGRETSLLPVDGGTSLDTMWSTVQAGLAADHPMTVSTRTDATAIAPEHGYAIVGAYERGGQRYVQLFNPRPDPGPRTTDVPLDTLRANVSGLWTSNS
jgi:hypothetical protein